MMVSFHIELTTEEAALLDRLEFDVLKLKDHHAFAENAAVAEALARSLLERDAVPDHRRRYFTDPAYNVGGRGSSNKQSFERYGCRGSEILRHAHFLPFLHYFIFGADLPAPARDAFRAAVDDCGMVTSSDIGPLGKQARALARRFGLEPRKAREEFFKLALDCGSSPGTASFIRDAVRTA